MNKVKKCKYCKSEIDYRAVICPHCGRKQGNPKTKKVIITIVAILIVISAIGRCAGSSESNNENAVNTEQPISSATENPTDEPKEKEYVIGETWTVDGQWSLTIDSVTVYNDRNQFSDKNPAAVYMVDYTYTNIGYEDASGIMDGLYINIGENIIDSTGFMGYQYPGNIVNYPKETPVGASCKAQACIGVDNAGSFKLNVSHYDGNKDKQSATFNIIVQ